MQKNTLFTSLQETEAETACDHTALNFELQDESSL